MTGALAAVNAQVDPEAAVHFTPAFGQVEENRAALVAACERAAAAGARVVVLPELATTGFCLDPAQAEAWAEPRGGPKQPNQSRGGV